MDYIKRLGSLELATVIFWFLFWLANGLAKFLSGTNIGIVTFGAPPGNPFSGALTGIGWPDWGDAFAAIAGIYELVIAAVFLWVIIQFIMRTGPAARRQWIFFGLFLSALIFAVFAFQNVIAFARPTPLIWHATFFGIVGVSWIVIAMQGIFERLNEDD